MLLQVSPNRLSLLLQIGCCLSQKYRFFPARLKSRHSLQRFPLQYIEQCSNIVRQIIQLHPKLFLRLCTEDLIQFARPPRLRIDMKKFITQQRLQLRRIHLAWDRCLQNLEDPRLVVKLDPTLRLGGLPELHQLSPRPLRLYVARRHHRYKNSHPFELFYQSVFKNIVSGQLWITPYLRRLTHQLSYPNLQSAMEVRNPSFASVDQAHIIDMGVADEGIAIEAHSVGPSKQMLTCTGPARS